MFCVIAIFYVQLCYCSANSTFTLCSYMMECKISEKLAIRPWIYTGRQETFSTVLASVSVSLSMPACNAEAEFSA